MRAHQSHSLVMCRGSSQRKGRRTRCRAQ